jgi:primary-amine oxidase
MLPAVTHPLDPLSVGELRAAVSLLRTEYGVGEAHRIVTVTLAEPAKNAVKRFRPGEAVEREALAVVYEPRTGETHEAVLSLTSSTVISWRLVPDVEPPVILSEVEEGIAAVKADPAFREALAARGITDLELVHVELWPFGDLAPEEERHLRLAWTPVWIRHHPDDNPYAHPVRGLHAVLDLRAMTVVRIEDHGAAPIPEAEGNYTPEAVGKLRDDLRPLEISQPDGPSFEIEGWEVRWQRWRLRVGFNQREGLVLHEVGYEDGGRVRPICYRASCAELVIPYGDAGSAGYRKNAFDIGEIGLGLLTNSLELGCDCLGEIRYLDVDLVDPRGEVVTLTSAICLHEEDAGVLWKHVDALTGRAEVRRSRRLVISSIATIDNYEYAFYWYLYLDGTIELEVKLTGIVLTSALLPGEEPRSGTIVSPGVNAMVHQHFFCMRLDLDVDGDANTVVEVHSEALPPGPENPYGNAFTQVEAPLRREGEAQRVIDPASGRYWKVENPSVINGLGRPVAYKLVPGANPLPLALPGSSVMRRAGFIGRHLWVTPYEPDERYPAGDYPFQHAGGAGLPEWTAADREIEDRDIVLWYVFGSHHVPRPEDWPVMPVEIYGFALKPVGFFDRNPALDVPPPHSHACHPHEEK